MCKKIISFNNLKDRYKIISLIDNEVTEFRVDKYDGEKYLASKKSLFPIFQFDADDFYFYDGTMEIGEVDKDYFSDRL